MLLRSDTPPPCLSPRSKLDHCLYDLLIRVESGELGCSIPIIISNHPGEHLKPLQLGLAVGWGDEGPSPGETLQLCW